MPPCSSTISLSYDRQMAPRVGAELSLSCNHSEGHIASPTSDIEADARDHVNLRFGIVIDEDLSVHFVASNLTDEDATQWSQTGPLYSVAGRMIETPRKIGIELSYDF